MTEPVPDVGKSFERQWERVCEEVGCEYQIVVLGEVYFAPGMHTQAWLHGSAQQVTQHVLLLMAAAALRGPTGPREASIAASRSGLALPPFRPSAPNDIFQDRKEHLERLGDHGHAGQSHLLGFGLSL